MAVTRGAFTVVNQMNPDFTKSWVVPSGGVTTIVAGSPTSAVDAAAASPYLGTVQAMSDGNGTTSQRFTGIAKNDSTDTASAAGVVTLFLPLPGLVYQGKAKTASTADTQAEVDALSGKRVVFDLAASTTWTIDAAAADAVVNCVVIIGGNYRTQQLQFWYSSKGTILDFCISA